MYSDFANALSQLRRDRRLSQRKVADDLRISQALLSHYENGIREPRLEFVVRICEYYGVSADQILGRNSSVEYDGADGADTLFTDTYERILLRLSERGDHTLSSSALRYLSSAAQKVLRAVETPEARYEPEHDAAMKLLEAELLRNSRKSAK